MVEGIKANECPIWVDPANVEHIGALAYQVFSPRTGGTYVIDLLAYNQMPRDSRFRARLTTWLVDQRRAGDAAPSIDSNILATIGEKPALMLSQRIERFFLYLSSLRFRPGQVLYTSNAQGPSSQLPEIMAWTEAEDQQDVTGFLDLLAASHLVVMPAPGALRLTADGFSRLEAIELASPTTTQAFVAMWFGVDMDQAYAQGFEVAIIDAGYRPLRIDRKEHANKIDDEIIMEIRRSRFIVADFTCPLIEGKDGVTRADARGGVYYEAGFAQGLDIPVIWTVRQDMIHLVHFDTRQFAHITWADPADLRVKLRNRIGAVITAQ